MRLHGRANRGRRHSRSRNDLSVADPTGASQPRARGPRPQIDVGDRRSNDADELYDPLIFRDRRARSGPDLTVFARLRPAGRAAASPSALPATPGISGRFNAAPDSASRPALLPSRSTRPSAPEYAVRHQRAREDCSRRPVADRDDAIPSSRISIAIGSPQSRHGASTRTVCPGKMPAHGQRFNAPCANQPRGPSMPTQYRVGILLKGEQETM
jgi:hypothetical protein